MDDSLSEFFEDRDFGGDDLFALLESFDSVTAFFSIDEATGVSSKEKEGLESQKCSSPSTPQEYSETELETSPNCKRQKLADTPNFEEAITDGRHRMSHITVERNRRKQMNEHLSVLRSLMPCFYVKRGDQASIIGGVVDYINELQQVLKSLESKKQRKVYREFRSSRLVPSPRPSPLSPRKPPVSPRLNLPISPRTPQPSSPYDPRMQLGYHSPTLTSPLEPSPISSASSIISNDSTNELVANSKSAIANVEVKFSGPNLLLKTVSPRIPGQVMKIISALEDLSLEILHASISSAKDTLLYSFTIKIGIECQLSAEELAHYIQQTFC